LVVETEKSSGLSSDRARRRPVAALGLPGPRHVPTGNCD